MNRSLLPKLEAMAWSHSEINLEVERYRQIYVSECRELTALKILVVFYAHFKLNVNSMEVVDIGRLNLIKWRGDSHGEAFHAD